MSTPCQHGVGHIDVVSTQCRVNTVSRQGGGVPNATSSQDGIVQTRHRVKTNFLIRCYAKTMSCQRDAASTRHRVKKNGTASKRCRLNTTPFQEGVVSRRCRVKTVSCQADVVSRRRLLETAPCQDGALTKRCRAKKCCQDDVFVFFCNTTSGQSGVVSTRCFMKTMP